MFAVKTSMKKNLTFIENKNLIIKMYNSGTGIQTISKSFNIPTTTLHRNLTKEGVVFRGYSEAQSKTRVKHNPFENLFDEDVQYWLGFLAADGCIQAKSNDIVLHVSIKDLEHLKKYAEFLKIPNDIKFIESTNSARVAFGNKKVKNFLISLGITPKKSNTLKLNIPITNHLLRGIFDGDGCISKSIRRTKTYYKWSIVTNSKQLSIQIQSVLDQLNLNYSLKCYNKLYTFSTSSKSELKKLKDYLYKDATIFLERKYSKMQAAIQEIE